MKADATMPTTTPTDGCAPRRRTRSTGTATTPPAPAPAFDMRASLAALDRLSVPEIAARYAELHGKPPRIRHKRYLVKRCVWREQERILGGLSQAALARLEDLMAQIVIPDVAPNRVAIARLEKRRAKAAVANDAARQPTAPESPPRRPGLPRPGMVIEREWRGRVLRLTVLEDGFELDGVVHKSLSAAAKAATKAHWNPTLFWKLTAPSATGARR